MKSGKGNPRINSMLVYQIIGTSNTMICLKGGNMLTIRDIKRAEEIGVTETSVRMRIYKGWDKEKAITTPKQRRNLKPYYEIARKNGISESLVRSRIYSNNWDIERAITEPKQKTGTHRKYYDKAVKNGLDITFQAFRNRLYNGWGLKEAMTVPRGGDRGKPINEYQKYKKIAEENGIGYKTFSNRVRAYNWSYERAATEPVHTNKMKNQYKKGE